MKPIIFAAILIFAFCFTTFAQNLEKESVSQTDFEKELKTFNGKTFRLADSKAKGSVILLWASWSPPASLAFKDLGKINSELAKNKIRILGLLFDDTKRGKNRTKYYARKLHIKYNNSFADKDLFKNLKMSRVPTI